MVQKKVLIGFGIDVDAVAGWLDTQDGSTCDSVKLSRGVFGAAVGINRLLNLFDTHNIKASWYVPAHTCESFPRQVMEIRDRGHEIGLHGYTHEYVSSLSHIQEAKVLRKSIEVLTAFLGYKPRGWTAPGWSCSASTVEILEEAGIEYDHSYMHHDCLLYYTPYSNCDVKETNYALPAETWMHPSPAPRISSVVTVPANWHLDDWPAFSPGDGGSDGFIDPDAVLRMWKSHFLYCYNQYNELVMPISLHPQISGKPHVLMMIEEFIEWTKKFQGIEWCTFGTMVDRFKTQGFARWHDLEK